MGLTGGDGKPLRIHRRIIRTSFGSHRDRKRWFGGARGRIDPNHSPRVEGDHYLTAPTPAQRNALESIMEEAQGDLLCKALPPVVLSDDGLAELAVRGRSVPPADWFPAGGHSGTATVKAGGPCLTRLTLRLSPS
ncbi:MAG TPA: hypothetical protein VFY14_13500, partial [Streptomyces sp.]|nr:hypothetical protein [Streptomyces sp.]